MILKEFVSFMEYQVDKVALTFQKYFFIKKKINIYFLHNKKRIEQLLDEKNLEYIVLLVSEINPKLLEVLNQYKFNFF